MKHTKNMIYKPTDNSRDIVLCAECNSDIYYSHIIPIKEALKKKMIKGIYSPEKAADLWYTAATAQAQILSRDFGTQFTVTDRFTAAVDLEKDFRDDVLEIANYYQVIDRSFS